MYGVHALFSCQHTAHDLVFIVKHNNRTEIVNQIYNRSITAMTVLYQKKDNLNSQQGWISRGTSNFNWMGNRQCTANSHNTLYPFHISGGPLSRFTCIKHCILWDLKANLIYFCIVSTELNSVLVWMSSLELSWIHYCAYDLYDRDAYNTNDYK